MLFDGELYNANCTTNLVKLVSRYCFVFEGFLRTRVHSRREWTVKSKQYKQDAPTAVLPLQLSVPAHPFRVLEVGGLCKSCRRRNKHYYQDCPHVGPSAASPSTALCGSLFCAARSQHCAEHAVCSVVSDDTADRVSLTGAAGLWTPGISWIPRVHTFLRPPNAHAQKPEVRGQSVTTAHICSSLI